MSDHLPLVAELTAEYPVQTQPDTCTNHHPWLDWEQATKSGEINEYRQLMKQQLSELTSHACLEGLEDIEAAISHLSDTLKDAAANRYLKSATRNVTNGKMQLSQHSVLAACPAYLEGERMPKRTIL